MRSRVADASRRGRIPRRCRLEDGPDPADARGHRLLARDAEAAAQVARRPHVRAAAQLAADALAGRAVADRVDGAGIAVLLTERADRADRASLVARHDRALDDEGAREPRVD